MQIDLYDERRSFLFFLIFILITVFFLSFQPDSPIVVGLLGILWGVFGFFRLLYLSQNKFSSLPKIISLPSRILFGMGQQEEVRRDSILKRLVQPDIMFWLGGSVAFVLWALFCSVDPAQITMIRTLRLKQEILVDFPIKTVTDSYAIMLSLSLYGIIGIIMYGALSYSYSPMAIRWACYSLLPIFFVSTILTFIFSSMASPALWINIQTFKGGGLGQVDILTALAPEMMGKSGTSLVKRFTELGSMGAYGVYIIFMPAFIMVVKALLQEPQMLFKSLICFSILAILLVLDVLWIATPFIDGLTILGLSLVALFWGMSGNTKES